MNSPGHAHEMILFLWQPWYISYENHLSYGFGKLFEQSFLFYFIIVDFCKSFLVIIYLLKSC